MNSLDVFNIGAEIRRMINLILEEDTSDFVTDEVSRLDSVVGCVQIVIL